MPTSALDALNTFYSSNDSQYPRSKTRTTAEWRSCLSRFRVPDRTWQVNCARFREYSEKDSKGLRCDQAKLVLWEGGDDTFGK